MISVVDHHRSAVTRGTHIGQYRSRFQCLEGALLSFHERAHQDALSSMRMKQRGEHYAS
jgi:hypothetical protein